MWVHLLCFFLEKNVLSTVLTRTVYGILRCERPPWSCSYYSCIYDYLCNQYLSQLTLWVRIPLRRGVLDTTLCGKVCQWLRQVGDVSPVSSTNITDRHDIAEILLKVMLNTINQTIQRGIIKRLSKRSSPQYILAV